MKLQVYILFSLIIFCSQCTPNENSFNWSANSQKDGFTKMYYSHSKNLKFEGHLKNSLPHGFCKFYYESGGLKSEAHYEMGEQNGFSKSYFENGKVEAEGHFKNNNKTGYWKYYYKNGELKNEKNY